MKFNLQYLPFYSNDPIPKRPNSPNASTITNSQKHSSEILRSNSFGSLNDFLANQSPNNLSELNLEKAPYATTNPTNFQPLSTSSKSRFSL
ncbi:MAG: hypothetical protein ACO26G_02075 [Rickettsiales bacterium]